jgi:hypothetical protein
MPEAGAFEPHEYSFGFGFDSVAVLTSFTAAAAAASTGSIGQHSFIASSQEWEIGKDDGGNAGKKKAQRRFQTLT